MNVKNILITGSEGFVGKNLVLAIKNSYPDIEILKYPRISNENDLEKFIRKSDLIFHLAGSNRPSNIQEFYEINENLTKKICNIIIKTQKKIPIVFTSTIQATKDNDYGKSKLKAESHLLNLKKENDSDVYIYRLTNLFGKWCKPNYNSVVATFCNNIIRDIDIRIDDPKTSIELTYIDDVINEFLDLINENKKLENPIHISNTYKITLEDLASQIRQIKYHRSNHIVDGVGKGFKRALYATYLSYLEPENFLTNLNSNTDERGNFVEMVKTIDSGQFSFFSAYPGVTRGSHFHHTKNEKFLVVSGKAKFRFKNMKNSKDFHEFFVDADNPQIVETIPGWAHDITNIGNSKMLVMLWANEIFDEKNPDTFWESLEK